MAKTMAKMFNVLRGNLLVNVCDFNILSKLITFGGKTRMAKYMKKHPKKLTNDWEQSCILPVEHSNPPHPFFFFKQG